jgi:DNA-binding transcriptional regulator PaaX
MSDNNEKMTRDEIKEFIFDVYVEVIEATGSAPALPPSELARLAEEPENRVKGCMMELEREGVLEKFKEDGDLYFHLSEDVLDDLIAEMEADGWEPPADPFGEADEDNTDA